jgi:hypothetical protein
VLSAGVLLVLVEIARRLGMCFIAARAEMEAEKQAKHDGEVPAPPS